MKKCLKITLVSNNIDGGFKDSVQGAARKLDLEGTMQFVEPNELIIIACGEKDNIDSFLDNLHQGLGINVPDDVQVEPFLKEKDYRGIFRILE
jgi:acylphosphatase